MSETLNEVTQKVALLEQHKDLLADGLSEVKGNLDALNDNLITLKEFKEEVEKNINGTINEIVMLQVIVSNFS